MKRFLLYSFLCLSSFVFSQTNNPKELDSITKVRRQYYQKELQLLEEKCKQDSKRAEEDSKYNFTYSLSTTTPASGSDFFPAEKELIAELRKYNIGYGGYILGNCFGLPTNCYQIEMTRLSKQKFGEAFFVSRKQEALKTFLKKNPQYIFEFEQCERTSRYASAKDISEMFHQLHLDLEKKIIYPKEFNFKKEDERKSYSHVSFVLNTDGKASNIYINTDFKNKKNYAFTEFMHEQITKFVKSAKWKPAAYASIPVKSKMTISIEYQ
ncbi:hypothetical protein [Soonwooa sp.]|uniref:hypothetical protein n=1 Tax=Soonwooa sp. TaxID=1938592 RepID=UPI002602DCD7|nr:hypothetical protein [Soonwooa sp.]